MKRVSARVRFGLSFVVWLLACGVLALVLEPFVAKALKPVFRTTTGWLLVEPLQIDSFSLDSTQNVPMYKLNATLTKPWRLGLHTIPADSGVQVTHPRAYVLFHIVLIVAILGAWPGVPVVQRFKVMGIGVVVAIVSASVDLSTTMAAQTHALFYEEFAPRRLTTSWLLKLHQFFDYGGRYLLPSVSALAVARVNGLSRNPGVIERPVAERR